MLTAAIMLLFLGYVGSYFVLLDAPQWYCYGQTHRLPGYRIKSKAVWRLYLPLMATDMHIRPHYW